MALKLRPTGLGHGVYKDNVDYGVFCGEWCIGRIYETRTGPCRSVLVLAMASAEYGPCLRAFWLPPRSPVTGRRACDTGRLASRAIDKGSRSGFALRIDC